MPKHTHSKHNHRKHNHSKHIHFPQFLRQMIAEGKVSLDMLKTMDLRAVNNIILDNQNNSAGIPVLGTGGATVLQGSMQDMALDVPDMKSKLNLQANLRLHPQPEPKPTAPTPKP